MGYEKNLPPCLTYFIKSRDVATNMLVKKLHKKISDIILYNHISHKMLYVIYRNLTTFPFIIFYISIKTPNNIRFNELHFKK